MTILFLFKKSKQECIPVGCVPSAAVGIGGWEGVCLGRRGCLPRGGVCPGDVSPSMHWVRVSAWGGGGVSQHALGGDVYLSACWDTHPPHRLWTE